jgi:outer membrane protein OmpA-like peptidoglycan-associated protein
VSRLLIGVLGLVAAAGTLGGCAASLNDLRATHAGFEVELTQVADKGRACAPVAYAKAEAEHAFAAIEFVQGDVLRAIHHMEEARTYLEVAKVASAGCTVETPIEEFVAAPAIDPTPTRPELDVDRTTDSDGDGIVDADDRCPSKPEDRDGWADADGCPDLDNDGDGFPDLTDNCPNEAEDQDGTLDTDGCVDPDDDGDGILDVSDLCPNAPETFNGHDDTDGCPDEALTRVRLDRNQVVLVEPIQFNGKTTELTPASYLVLNELSVFLESQVATRVRIESHTDSGVDETANQLLTQQQAEVVVVYLVEQGIGRTRMEIVGYGSRMPIDTNRTPEGRTRNRRIEIYVIP